MHGEFLDRARHPENVTDDEVHRIGVCLESDVTLVTIEVGVSLEVQRVRVVWIA